MARAPRAGERVGRPARIFHHRSRKAATAPGPGHPHPGTCRQLRNHPTDGCRIDEPGGSSANSLTAECANLGEKMRAVAPEQAYFPGQDLTDWKELCATRPICILGP
jgi:hypothetical protein